MRALEYLSNPDLFPWAWRALVVGVVIAGVCSLLSVFVVLKRMAFVGQGVSHAGFGAAGLAALLGLGDGDWRYDLVVFAFCIATAVLIGVLSRKRRVDADTAIGILLVAGMALGVVLRNLSIEFQTPGRSMYWGWYAQQAQGVSRPSFETLLFGALLGTTVNQMWLAIALGAAVVGVTAAFFKEILFFTFDEPTSRVFGVPAGFVHHLLMVLLAVTVVLTMKLAGVLMVSAMLVAPGAAALQVSRRLGTVLLLSCLFGAAGAVGGVLLSLEVGFVGPGPCIVGVLLGLFAIVYVWRGWAQRR